VGYKSQGAEIVVQGSLIDMVRPLWSGFGFSLGAVMLRAKKVEDLGFPDLRG